MLRKPSESPIFPVRAMLIPLPVCCADAICGERHMSIMRMLMNRFFFMFPNVLLVILELVLQI